VQLSHPPPAEVLSHRQSDTLLYTALLDCLVINKAPYNNVSHSLPVNRSGRRQVRVVWQMCKRLDSACVLARRLDEALNIHWNMQLHEIYRKLVMCSDFWRVEIKKKLKSVTSKLEFSQPKYIYIFGNFPWSKLTWAYLNNRIEGAIQMLNIKEQLLSKL